jgi:hypothetical protein
LVEEFKKSNYGNVAAQDVTNYSNPINLKVKPLNDSGKQKKIPASLDRSLVDFNIDTTITTITNGQKNELFERIINCKPGNDLLCRDMVGLTNSKLMAYIDNRVEQNAWCICVILNFLVYYWYTTNKNLERMPNTSVDSFRLDVILYIIQALDENQMRLLNLSDNGLCLIFKLIILEFNDKFIKLGTNPHSHVPGNQTELSQLTIILDFLLNVPFEYKMKFGHEVNSAIYGTTDYLLMTHPEISIGDRIMQNHIIPCITCYSYNTSFLFGLSKL